MALDQRANQAEYMLERIMYEVRDLRRMIEETRRDQYDMMRTFHSYTSYVERFDPRIRDGYLMELRLKDATRSTK